MTNRVICVVKSSRDTSKVGGEKGERKHARLGEIAGEEWISLEVLYGPFTWIYRPVRTTPGRENEGRKRRRSARVVLYTPRDKIFRGTI